MRYGKQKHLAPGQERVEYWLYVWLWLALEGEPSARGRRSNCPATKWALAKRHLHNTFSGDILELYRFHCWLLPVHVQRSSTRRHFHPVLDAIQLLFSRAQTSLWSRSSARWSQANNGLCWPPIGKLLSTEIGRTGVCPLGCSAQLLSVACWARLWWKTFIVRQAGHRRGCPRFSSSCWASSLP
jgi:hypothetical protein